MPDDINECVPMNRGSLLIRIQNLGSNYVYFVLKRLPVALQNRGLRDVARWEGREGEEILSKQSKLRSRLILLPDTNTRLLFIFRD